ncbi:Uma2 family endonuclease [Spirosoma sp. BT702]|uniref:Uma2 family endonuclease n=1 Tax=Spirosoma profusum TaxID=2771354 RepID=A0A926Y0X3_9BACT|nr:Uma2 family endonuclease [Spirosoma profusum]MBD2704559.1 Uma2 family endonuclease [Spirosoma profusum]
MIAEKVYIAPDVYLRQERDAPSKSEYVNGDIIPIAGASTNHNRIKENTAIEIGLNIRGKGCRSYSSDQRVNVPTDSLYAYPDIVVVCGPNQYHDSLHDTLTNPMLIVEVLSPGTAAFDRGDKFALYRQSLTFQEYLFIDSEKMRVEVFRKHERGYWFLASEANKTGETVELAIINLSLPLETIYAETEGVLR